MAELAFRWEGRSKVPPAAARAWWFDVQEDDHRSPEHQEAGRGRPGDGRRVLARGAGEAEVEDTWNGRRFTTRLRLQGQDAITLESRGQGMTSRATYRFLPAPGGGSRVVAETVYHLQGLLTVLAPLFRGRFERQHRADMDLHLRHMEREWGERPWA